MFKNITLEISLKPFKKTDGEYIRGVAKKIFTQWAPLLKGRETISVMLWASDGSEILDYAGELSDEFEWARFIGTANLPYRTENEPKETSLHERKQDYIENAPVMTYGTLKAIISAIKEEGKAAFPDAKIRVGETFDIGPEFAISDFKYNRHREISSGYTLDKFGFVDATATLKGDTRRYAAYPDGIPDGTLFGTFLGKQSEKFLSDMGFDYLWLSNGLGFSSDPWLRTGKIFDGEKYYPEKLGDMKNKVFAFWKLFREECSFPLETRGTNNSVGIDYASDGVPLYDRKCLFRAERGEPAPAGRKPSFRVRVPDRDVTFTDILQGEYRENLDRECSDFVVRRSDGVYAYQLAVVVDDALSGVNEVVRGKDLLSSTPRQMYLQKLWGFAHPSYVHIPLLTDAAGRRLSKRDGDGCMENVRERYVDARPVIGALAAALGLIPSPESMTVEQLLPLFDWKKIPRDAVLLPKGF